MSDQPLDVQSSEQKKKMAQIVSLMGAFNYEVGMAFPREKLRTIYAELIKRFALIAETSRTGAGSLFLDFIRGSDYSSISRDEFKYNLESIIVFGYPYADLSATQKIHTQDLQILGESSHFSRIMDVDDLSEKKIVGLKDAGNQRMVRMMLNVIRYREELQISPYWPPPSKILIDAPANYSVPHCPTLIRSTYPYAVSIVSAWTPETAKEVMEIFRRLICQYPIELVLILIEEWLTTQGIVDSYLSITGAQVFQQYNSFKVKIVNAGGGFVVFCGNDKNEPLSFCVEGHEQASMVIGQIDVQSPHFVQVFDIEPFSRVILFPKTAQLPTDFNLEQIKNEQRNKIIKILNIRDTSWFNYATFKVSPQKHKPFHQFQWSREYIKNQLTEFVQRIKGINPQLINIQYGHVHSDRLPGKDQEIGALITGVLGEQLKGAGTELLFMPMVDNYHVEDRIDIPAWLELLESNSGFETNEPTFESALITRHYGNEAIVQLYRQPKQSLSNIGGNVYLEVDEYCRIELYDGVGQDYKKPGRMGCVPFEVGYELYRLNPPLANGLYRDHILKNFPNSLIAKWWLESPNLTYQQLIYKYVYSLPPKERQNRKTIKDQEIELPYQTKVLESTSDNLEALLTKTDRSKVVLIHVMEQFYDAQHAKFVQLWKACNLPPINLWRIGFNRHNGDIQILDMTISKEKYKSIVGEQII